MDIFIAIIIFAGALTALLYGLGLNAFAALLVTVISGSVVFYFWLTHEAATSTNAYGLAAWPALLAFYLVIVILSGLAGIGIVRKARKSVN